LQVFASGTGNNRHPLFFLKWMWRRSKDKKQPARKPRASKDLNLPTIKSPIKQALQPAPAASLPVVATMPTSSPQLPPIKVKPGALPLIDASSIAAAPAAAGSEYQEPADVAAERRKVEAMQDYANHPTVVKHLQKTYPSRDGQPPKVGRAVCVCVLTTQRTAELVMNQLEQNFFEQANLHINSHPVAASVSCRGFLDTAAAAL
jgi:hypothetical protein